MGRMTEWMFWIGLALLFGAGLLFGLAVANAETVEPVIRHVDVSSDGYWEPGIRMIVRLIVYGIVAWLIRSAASASGPARVPRLWKWAIKGTEADQ
jgi:hypothetical protein